MQKESQDFVIAIISGTLFILLFGCLAFLVVVNYVRSKRKLLQEKIEREAAFQKELMHAQMEMQEHTFRSIAQEIHDNIGQILGLIKLNVNLLGFEMKGNEIVATLSEQTKKAIAELRDLGTTYHTDKLAEQGLIVAAKNQLNQLQKTGFFETSFQSEFEKLNIEKNKMIFLYRMLQEALNNIVKHAGANKIWLSIYSQGEEVYITLQDNGRGFNPTDQTFKPGIGLNSMQERAAMINVRAEVKSIPGEGTTVNFIFKQKNL